jgi:hypothetical protein
VGAQAAPNGREPHLGYVYPAGGKQGITLHAIAAGQQFRGVSEVYITGSGVHATVSRPVPNIRNLERDQLLEARKRLLALRQNPRADSTPIKPESKLRGELPATQTPRKRDDPTSKPATQPSAPPEVDVDALSLRELEYYLGAIRSRDKRQVNPQLAQVVLLEITIDANAAPGDRELRLGGPTGLTNPLRFQVGGLPEISEQEPIGGEAPTASTLSLPLLINGQIMPGDVDKFRFQAKRGQRLVIDVQARRLIPYLADAVPGWFQATVALYDAAGAELAFVDDYRFNPDPVLLYEVPDDGEYRLELRDALYRGREDFVYRVSVGELPFVTQIFPLGGQAGSAATAGVFGWNLRRERIQLEAPAGAEGIRSTFAQRGKWRSNEFLYAVDTLPARFESEPNDDREHAQRIAPPRMVNGRIDPPDDVDVYQVAGRAGEELVAEVSARRLNSPLDSRLSITAAAGKVLAWNDDMDAPATGLLTHNADSYLRVKLPATGVYYVKVADAQQHGGPEYGYRLRLSAPRPDFELRLAPSCINVPAGRVVPVCVYVLRKDGFNGDIDLALTNAPAGFILHGARIPGGCDRLRFTIAAPRDPSEHPLTLELEGRAEIGHRTVTRAVIPAADMMQAFSYRHLVPSQELLATVLPTKQTPPVITLADASPVRIPVGGTAEVRVNTPARNWLRKIELTLSEPPAGVTLVRVDHAPDGVTLVLKADQETAPPGLRDNLIVEGFMAAARPEADAQTKRTARVSVGFLPAIPFEIVRP